MLALVACRVHAVITLAWTSWLIRPTGMANRHNIYKSSRRGFFPGTPLVTRQGPRGASHGDNWRTITPTQSSLTWRTRTRQAKVPGRERGSKHPPHHPSVSSPSSRRASVGTKTRITSHRSHISHLLVIS